MPSKGSCVGLEFTENKIVRSPVGKLIEVHVDGSVFYVDPVRLSRLLTGCFISVNLYKKAR